MFYCTKEQQCTKQFFVSVFSTHGPSDSFFLQICHHKLRTGTFTFVGGWCFSMWRKRLLLTLNAFPHSSQVWHFKPPAAWILKCLRIVSAEESVFPQRSQIPFSLCLSRKTCSCSGLRVPLAFACPSWCLISDALLPIIAPHSSQLNGFVSAWATKACLFRLTGVDIPIPHSSQVNGFPTPWTNFMCLPKAFALSKFESHCLQSRNRTLWSLWLDLLCARRASLALKPAWQWLHLKGQWPVWIILCLLSSCALENSDPHSSHLWSRSAVWVARCLCTSFLELRVSVLPQMVQV